MEKEYDSKVDTEKHIQSIRKFLDEFRIELYRRGFGHDDSKLYSPERELFDEYTPKLSAVEYGSEEYNRYLKEMGKALDHHYKHNSHHPEHYENGINGMNLVDIVEMFCDWKAASMRHEDGNLVHSIHQNQDRFNMSEQLTNIFLNTAKLFDW